MSNGLALWGRRIAGAASFDRDKPGLAPIAVDDSGLVFGYKGANVRAVDNTLAQTLAGAVSLGSTLDVTGAATLGSTLDVTGATTLSSTLDVTGALTCTTTAFTWANGLVLTITRLTELLTIADAATSETTIEIPAGSLVIAVPVRVTVAIPTASTFTVGITGTADKFNSGSNLSVDVDTTDVGTKAGVHYQAAAATILITPDMSPAAATGRLRVGIVYAEITPFTS